MRTKRLLAPIGLLTAVVATPLRGHAQAVQLLGVDSAAVAVLITGADDVPGADTTMLRQKLQTIVELELRDRGLIVVDAALHVISFNFVVVENDSGTAAYAYNVQYITPIVTKYRLAGALATAYMAVLRENPDVKTAGDNPEALKFNADVFSRFSQNVGSATTAGVAWQSGLGVATVGTDNFLASIASTAEDMAREFANEWLKVNPK